MDTRLRSIARLMKKWATSQKIIIEDISLGKLRQNYERRHSKVDQDALKAEEHTFTRYAPDSTRPLEIRAEKDSGLLLYRLPATDPKVAQTLYDSINALPPMKKKAPHKGINGGEYEARHYELHCKHSPEPLCDREFLADGDTAWNFLAENKLLWDHMTICLGHAAPGVFKEIQKFPVGNKQRLCGAYAGCVVINYGKDMDHTVPHCDIGEPPIMYSCMGCCGDFTKGGLILYDLKIIVEMNPGYHSIS